mgnify:CR=1 FL=1
MPVMLTVSLEDDEFVDFIDIEKTYKEVAGKIPDGLMHFFPSGGHSAMITNADEFFDLAMRFLK